MKEPGLKLIIKIKEETSENDGLRRMPDHSVPYGWKFIHPSGIPSSITFPMWQENHQKKIIKTKWEIEDNLPEGWKSGGLQLTNTH